MRKQICFSQPKICCRRCRPLQTRLRKLCCHSCDIDFVQESLKRPVVVQAHLTCTSCTQKPQNNLHGIWIHFRSVEMQKLRTAVSWFWPPSPRLLDSGQNELQWWQAGPWLGQKSSKNGQNFSRKDYKWANKKLHLCVCLLVLRLCYAAAFTQQQLLHLRCTAALARVHLQVLSTSPDGAGERQFFGGGLFLKRVVWACRGGGGGVLYT